MTTDASLGLLDNVTQQVTAAAAGTLGLGLFYIAWHLGRSESRGTALNFLVLILGIVSGWILAFMWTPLTVEQKQTLQSIQGAIAVFVSGYAVSKLDRLLEAALYGADGKPSPSTLVRGGLFLAALAVTATTVVTFRIEYLDWKAEKERQVKEQREK